MTCEELSIDGRSCHIFLHGSHPSALLIQPTGKHELSEIQEEASLIAELSGHADFGMICFDIVDWTRELSPWYDPAVSADTEVGQKAQQTLSYIRERLIPYGLEEFGDLPCILGGYSLGGLFSLWAACETTSFRAIAACSPSVWIKDWDVYSHSHPIKSADVYLSLGDQEEKAKNKTIARVGDCLRQYYRELQYQLGPDHTTLEWNSGGHFVDGAGRCAKGFAWALRQVSMDFS